MPLLVNSFPAVVAAATNENSLDQPLPIEKNVYFHYGFTANDW